MKKKIVLITCCRKKKCDHRPRPARDIYCAERFVAEREYAERVGGDDGWFILSAKHKLLSPKAEIESYDQTLSNDNEKKAWGETVDAMKSFAENPLPPTGRRMKPSHPGEILRDIALPGTTLSISKTAQLLDVSRRHLRRILDAERPVTPEIAARLSALFKHQRRRVAEHAGRARCLGSGKIPAPASAAAACGNKQKTHPQSRPRAGPNRRSRLTPAPVAVSKCKSAACTPLGGCGISFAHGKSVNKPKAASPIPDRGIPAGR